MTGQIDKSAGLMIIADDLTGALDASAPLAGADHRVIVATSPAALNAALQSSADVVAVSTRSREITATDAARRVADVVAAIPTTTRLFKKVDSRLKGQIAAELAALPDGPLLVCPAIPGFDRIVKNGAIEGFGISAPIPIAPLLGKRASSAIIPDVTSQPDLQAALDAAPTGTVLVGARGMGEALAGRVAPPRPDADGPRGDRDRLDRSDHTETGGAVAGHRPVAAMRAGWCL